MDIELNGQLHQITEGQTLSDLLASLELSQKNVAVAVNRQIIPKVKWELHCLQAQDKVDVVRAIGGG